MLLAVDDLAHARALCDDLGEIFCLTFLKGVGAPEALLRMGGCPDTFRNRTGTELGEAAESFDAGFPAMAMALPLGAWTVVIEPDGFEGADDALLEAASRGTEAVSVLRHDYASAHFGYAVDGTTVAGFDPGYPAEETSWGSDPAMLRPLMDALGLRPPSDESDESWLDAEARAIVLAQRITGVRVPDQPLLTAGLSAHLEPWFVTRAARGDLLRADRYAPHSAELAAAAEAADPDVQRAVAVAEARRQAAALGIADAPGLAEALDAAARGTAQRVTMESVLGRQVRGWLDAQRRASASTNVPHRHRMTEDERGHAFGLGWFVAALRGVLDGDPRVAVLAALRPHISGLPALSDEASRAAVLRALRGEPQDRLDTP